MGGQVLALDQGRQRHRLRLAQAAHAGLLRHRLQGLDAAVGGHAHDPDDAVLHLAGGPARRARVAAAERQDRGQRLAPTVLRRADEERRIGIGRRRRLAQQRRCRAPREARQPGQLGTLEAARQGVGVGAQIGARVVQVQRSVRLERRHVDAQPGRQQQVMQRLQRLQARGLGPPELKVRRRLRCVAQALVDGVDPDPPETEPIGLARFAGRELARLAPGGRCRLGQQRHQVEPDDRWRGQVLAPADFGSGQFPGRFELACAGFPLAIGDRQRGLHQLDAAAAQRGAERARAGQVGAKQQGLGEAAAQGRGHAGRCARPARQQPVFERLAGRFRKAAEQHQHAFCQLGLQGRFEPVEQGFVEGLEHGAAQRAGPQMGEAVGQVAQALQRADGAPAEDHQPQRGGELFFLLEAERICLVEVDELAPGIEPRGGARRVQHQRPKARRCVGRGRAHPALRVARGVAGSEQPVDDAAHLDRVEAAAALGAQAGRRHHVGDPRHTRWRLQHAQRVVHLGIVGAHRAIQRGDVADGRGGRAPRRGQGGGRGRIGWKRAGGGFHGVGK